MEQQPRVIYAEPLNEDDLAEEIDSYEALEDGDIAADIPVMKRRKVEPEEDTSMLTKHFKLNKSVGPTYTGGTIKLLKNG